MFGKKQQAPIRTLIGEGTVIRGELHFTDGLRIDGTVLGDVLALGEGRNVLVISDKARVEGTVQAGHVVVNGTVVGPVTSTELLELQPKASITGDVRYESLEMHQGALIDGELRPIRGEPREGEKAPLKLAASNQ
jgi:cytoskeletal protein CcmA (bactofilin family)